MGIVLALFTSGNTIGLPTSMAIVCVSGFLLMNRQGETSRSGMVILALHYYSYSPMTRCGDGGLTSESIEPSVQWQWLRSALKWERRDRANHARFRIWTTGRSLATVRLNYGIVEL